MAINAMIPMQGQVADPLNALASGYKLGNTIRQQPMVDQMNQQKLQAGQMELDQQKMKMQEMAKDSRIKSAVMGAAELQSAPVEQWTSILQDRIQGASRYAYDASAEKEALQILQTKGPEALKAQVDGLVKFGSMAGIFSNGQTAWQRQFDSMTQGMTPDEKMRAQRIAAGLDPRAVAAAPRPTDIGGVTYIVDPNSSTATLPTLNQPVSGTNQQGALLPPIPGGSASTQPSVIGPNEVASNVEAIEAAKLDAKTANEREAKAKQNAIALSVYESGIGNLQRSLEGTVTGPVVGSLPAMTSSAQMAEGAVAAMAPILKEIFRVSGEGTFTDKDQELLLGMIPKRTTLPEARTAQLQAIDAIVRAKLGAGQSQQASQAKYAVGQIVEMNGRKYRVIGGDMNDPDVEEVQ